MKIWITNGQTATSECAKRFTQRVKNVVKLCLDCDYSYKISAEE